MSNGEGVFCSTAGSVFTNKAAFTEHYKSAFHLYNLKRRVAGLPPVTREWFEARKSEVLAAASERPKPRIWTDPLTKKKFQTEAKYTEFIQSKRYQSILKNANLTSPPDPHIIEKSEKTEKDPVMDGDEASKDWDVMVSLFDNVKSASFEANLEYMFKNFGFYFPNSEYLTDPHGLMQYLGAKLSEGHIPLYCSGLDPNAKMFTSLHAVQRHVIDVHKCTMLFDGNEGEYEDFYDMNALFDIDTGMALAEVADLEDASGLEIIVRDDDGRSKILGNREFWYVYRQRHRRVDNRESVLSGHLVSKYRSLGIRTKEAIPESIKRSRKAEAQRRTWHRMKTELRSNVNNNLPRNVPY